MKNFGGVILNLYISDLDGTLLNSDQVISKNSINIINRLIKLGLKFTIATARSYEACQSILEPLNLNIPIILNNGAFIYDTIYNKNVVENYIDDNMVKFILNYYSSKNIFPIVSAVNSIGQKKVFYRGIFNYGQNVYINSRKERGDKRLEKIDDFSILKGYNIINIFAIEAKGILDDTYKLFTKKIRGSFHYTEEIYARGFFWLESMNINSSKNSAAKFLKDSLKADKLICFGDNLNDLPLFKLADEKYAVENAYQPLKDLSTGVIESNNKDGVAKFIENNFKSA